ncbi:unnamed protein product [Fusarium graminearum]|nr:unnamed protein product [Fusarium graminearum]
MTQEGKRSKGQKDINTKRHTTAGIRWSSPTQLLIRPLSAYLWESGRDPEFSDSQAVLARRFREFAS